MAWFAFLWNTWDERFKCHIRFYSSWTAKLLALLVINPMEARMIFKSQKILYRRNPLSEESSLRITQPKFFNDIYTTRSLLNIFALTDSRPGGHHTLNLFQPFIHRGSMKKYYNFWEELHRERNYFTNIIHKSTTCLVLSMSYTGLVVLVFLF